MCKENSRLRKQFLSPRENPVRQALETRQVLGEIKRTGVTRGEGDKRYTRPPDVTRIIDSYPSTHAPVTLAAGHAAELTLSGQELDLDLSGYATTGDLHNPVTISASLDAMLALSGQALDLDTQTANRVWAGPASGGAAKPTFRALVLADIPDLSSVYATAGDLHDPVTLGGANEPALALSGQELTLTAYNNPSTTADRLLKTGTGGLVTLEKLYINDNGGDSNFDTAVQMQVIDASLGISSNGANAVLDVFAYGGFSTFRARRAGGTRSSPSNVSADTEIARYGGAGYGSGFPTADMSYMSAYTSQAQTSTNKGHDLRFFTTPNGSTSTRERERITNGGLHWLLDTNVAHGMTNVADTDVYGQIGISSSTDGGIWVLGLTDTGDGPAARLAGYNGANLSTAKGTGARGAIALDAAIKSGSGITGVNANGNLVVVRDNFLTRAIVDAEGELHLDATLTENAWDDHDDLALLNGLRAAVLPKGHAVGQRLARFVAEARPVLEATGVATFNEDGSVFVGMKALQMLTIDALRQMYDRIDRRLMALEAVNA